MIQSTAKDRKLSELLQIMLDNQQLFRSGLCTWANDAFNYDYITFDEYLKLREYIKANRPSKYSSLNAFYKSIEKSGFYWTISKIKPRIKWLNKHIKKQKEIEKHITSFTINYK